MTLADYPRARGLRLIDEHYFIKRIDRVNERTANGIAKMLEEKNDQIARVVKYSGIPNHGYAVYSIPKEAWRDSGGKD